MGWSAPARRGKPGSGQVEHRTKGANHGHKTIGIDLGKTACDVVAMDGRGRVRGRRRLSRAKLALWLANLPPCRIGMEASCGAHHLARRLIEFGHDVRLMPAQYVRPFVKTNKHDRADAEAIRRQKMTLLRRRSIKYPAATTPGSLPGVPDFALKCLDVREKALPLRWFESEYLGHELSSNH
jgi:hypothetical protein